MPRDVAGPSQPRRGSREPRNRRKVARVRQSGEGRRGAGWEGVGCIVRACAVAVLVVLATLAARAVEAINVRTDAQAIDLTDAAERHRTEADRLLVSAAPGPDGIVRRMDVRAREGNTNWAVFALANSGDEQIERLIVVPHYRMVGSGVLGPISGAPASPASPRAASVRTARTAPPPTSSASRSIPAAS